jgi:hypothetical protein
MIDPEYMIFLILILILIVSVKNTFTQESEKPKPPKKVTKKKTSTIKGPTKKKPDISGEIDILTGEYLKLDNKRKK